VTATEALRTRLVVLLGQDRVEQVERVHLGELTPLGAVASDAVPRES